MRYLQMPYRRKLQQPPFRLIALSELPLKNTLDHRPILVRILHNYLPDPSPILEWIPVVLSCRKKIRFLAFYRLVVPKNLL